MLKLGSNIADLSEMCDQLGEWDRLLFSCAAVNMEGEEYEDKRGNEIFIW